MKNFATRAIVFYALAAISALMITGLTNVAIYWYFTVAGLSEFGNLLAFKIGLAVTETSLAIYCVSQLSEDVLYHSEDHDEEEPLTEEEKTL